MNPTHYSPLRDLTLELYSKWDYRINYNFDRLTINSDPIQNSCNGHYHDYNAYLDDYHFHSDRFDNHINAVIDRYRTTSKKIEGLMRSRPYYIGYECSLNIIIPDQGQVFIQYHPIQYHPLYPSRRSYVRVDFNPYRFDADGIRRIIYWLQLLLGDYCKEFFCNAKISRVDFNADLMSIIKKCFCYYTKHSHTHKLYINRTTQLTESSYCGSAFSCLNSLAYEKNIQCLSMGQPILYPDYEYLTRVEVRKRPSKKSGEIILLHDLADLNLHLDRLELYYIPSNHFLRQHQVPAALIAIIRLLRRHDLTRILQHIPDQKTRSQLLDHLQPYRFYPINLSEMEAAYRQEVGRLSELIAMTDPAYWSSPSIPTSPT